VCNVQHESFPQALPLLPPPGLPRAAGKWLRPALGRRSSPSRADQPPAACACAPTGGRLARQRRQLPALSARRASGAWCGSISSCQRCLHTDRERARDAQVGNRDALNCYYAHAEEKDSLQVRPALAGLRGLARLHRLRPTLVWRRPGSRGLCVA